MHPDLSPHGHSDECNILSKKLKECHEQHTLAKFVGYCNDIDALLVKCLRKEREERRRDNLAKARERQARIRNVSKN